MISPSQTASFSAARSVARIRSSDAADRDLPYRFRCPASAVNMRRTSRRDSSDSLIRPSAGTNGVPVSWFQDAGGLEVAEAGITGRGVLLDIAALHGRQWLDPGHAIGRDELEAAERSSGVNVRTGDIVLIRTGQFARREQDGPWDSAQAKAGLDVAAMPWFAEREVSALGFDGDGDVEPSRVPSVEAPVHVLGITAMGLHFFDALGLDDLASACAMRRRYEFLFTAAPIRLTGATGCLINPLALF
ncbi:cyclase family protein [Streptosporangium sp. NPDC006013]|uniref:cyclase family protein n=1 Tax=Streptosporangium sp. NPDC006013 TaxID=3155596 RepID=UPI0033A1017A